MELKERSILAAGATVEVLLAVIALTGIILFNLKIDWAISLYSTLFGIGAAAVLFGVNFSLIGVAEKRQDRLSLQLKRFRDEIAIPLARSISTSNAFALSILAGLCEELFFRGFIQNLFGIIVSGIAFTLLHFGPRMREWRFVGAVYFLISLFFSCVMILSGSLWAAIVAHAVYDALALLWLKRELGASPKIS
jgi:membrane protease YdiL (CAAX protease family)